MGLKSNEIDHLPTRQLKQTANEPVTKYVLLMTETYAQIGSLLSKTESVHSGMGTVPDANKDKRE